MFVPLLNCMLFRYLIAVIISNNSDASGLDSEQSTGVSEIDYQEGI